MESVAAVSWNAGDNDERAKLLRRHTALKAERSSWDGTYRDISNYILPRRGRFFTSDANKGHRRDTSIINNHGTRAANTLASGLMAGLTNPTRPWFRLTTPDPELNESGPVKMWTAAVEDVMRWVFQRSNIYLSLHSLYLDLPFGTSALHIDEDEKRILRAYLYPIGSYCLANSARQRVDTVYREFQMTAAQLVEKFGKAKCSKAVQDALTETPDKWFDVLHVIEPNLAQQKGKLGYESKPYKSCWLELAGDRDKQFLSESGYDEFPAMCPRWQVLGEDIYGGGPGHEAIGDAKALQQLESRKLLLIDKLSNPPMAVPSSLKGEPVTFNPGAHIFVDAVGPANQARPAYEVNPASVVAVEQTIRQHELRIDRSFYADLWLMLANDTEGKMTATEVNRRQEEKMLQLGPVLERLEEELLDPLIERTFAIMLRAGLVPEPPPEIQGMELKVEYISILAQAQQMIGIQGVRELTGFVMQGAAVVPGMLDKLDTDQIVDEYALMLGTKPNLVRTDEQVAEIRAQQAKEKAQQQALAMAQQGAETAKTMSETNLAEDNVLSRMLPTTTHRA